MSDDVFAAVVRDHRPALRDAALHAAFELGLFEPGADLAARRLRALTDVLVLEGALRREDGRLVLCVVPARPTVPPYGFGLLAEVLRSGQPLPTEVETDARLHRHLGEVGAAAARALALLDLAPGPRLLDIGGGAGTYTAAFLDASPAHTATLVDRPRVVALAREALARYGDRVRFVEGDALDVDAGAGHDAALLANVLHLHGPRTCARLVAKAAAAVREGGAVIVKDLFIEPDRSGPATALYFALSMALYTADGDVWEPAEIEAWLAEAGLASIRTIHLSEGAIVARGLRACLNS